MSVPKRPKPRIESLSDLIFGLALSIGTISLIAKVPRTPYEIMVDLLQFGFSFLILIFVWMSYTSIMPVLPMEDGTLQEELDGYKDYARRVRYRLLPGAW